PCHGASPRAKPCRINASRCCSRCTTQDSTGGAGSSCPVPRGDSSNESGTDRRSSSAAKEAHSSSSWQSKPDSDTTSGMLTPLIAPAGGDLPLTRRCRPGAGSANAPPGTAQQQVVWNPTHADGAGQSSNERPVIRSYASM